MDSVKIKLLCHVIYHHLYAASSVDLCTEVKEIHTRGQQLQYWSRNCKDNEKIEN